jgi:hypothetical protein
MFLAETIHCLIVSFMLLEMMPICHREGKKEMMSIAEQVIN